MDSSPVSLLPLQLLAVWVLADWMVAGEPRECQLIELGPGRGTLLKDMMRVRAIVYEVSSMLSISLSLVSGLCVMLNVAEEHKKKKVLSCLSNSNLRTPEVYSATIHVYIIRFLHETLCAGIWPV